MRNMILRTTVLLVSLASAATLASTYTAAAQSGKRVYIPAGTRILVRMVDSIDSSKQKAGFRFTATLETNLQMDDWVVAPMKALSSTASLSPRNPPAGWQAVQTLPWN